MKASALVCFAAVTLATVAAGDTGDVVLTASDRVTALQREVDALRATRQREVDEMKALKDMVAGIAKEEEVGRRLDDAAAIEDIQGAMNHIWLLMCGALVMFMQVGFAALETGAVRAKNAQHVLMKNLTDVCIGTMSWWSVGWMMAYGADTDPSTNFAGNKQYFHNDWYDIDDNGLHTPKGDSLSWFFQWAFSMATATIVSGGVAERINFPCYVTYCACMTGFIYPVVVYWTWSGSGWLYDGEDAITDVGYYDFAGSGIVHATGGVGALVCATILGPRKDRWTEPDENFAPHNIPLCVLGTFFLWFGWYGFNCGSTLGLADTATGQLAAHVAMNTTIAAATGGITVLVLRFIILRKYDVGGMCNGVLGGLVSITAGCGNVETFSAFVIAIIGGCCYQGASSLVKLLKIDDPLDAFAVHGTCGTWGVLAAVLFDWGKGFDIFNGWAGFECTKDLDDDTKCYKDGWVSAFGAQVVGILCIWLWVGTLSICIMGPLRILGFLRTPDDIQDEGTDTKEHSPVKAYGQFDGMASTPSSKGATMESIAENAPPPKPADAGASAPPAPAAEKQAEEAPAPSNNNEAAAS